MRRLLPLLMLLLPTLAPAQGYPPGEAAARMTAAEGLSVRLVASEPLVRQPVAIDFDDRGRLWVIQYLQYPNPEGLRRVAVDRYSRTKYDRLPDPPPRGPKGTDRITILEDTDGDGRMDRGKDFVSDLNLASGFAFGDGGVYVLNVPYLLFYPDRNRDDAPDGDPEVLLTGFGMDDAHSVANSLTWGPDGWLYGLQGSTVTANIQGIEFQQGVWRYHPRTRRFELFAEGGGNMWGLDFDRAGNLFASTNVGGNVLLHFVQGAYYWKQFGKHGPLHNPYAFGHLGHVKHEGARGGHVTVGGLFYEADAWPERYRGKYLAADLLDHSAHWHELTPQGSTFGAKQLGDLLRANDTWFAPTDMSLGPDGSVYITDWHDQRTAHPDPDAEWDRSNGRIYAIDGPTRKTVPARFDLQAAPTHALIEILKHPNIWHVRRARRILTERDAPAALPALREAVARWPMPSRLEALWALYACGEFDDELAAKLLDDHDDSVRAWTVRLLGETPRTQDEVSDGTVGKPLAARLLQLAEEDPSVVVRATLAGYAMRQEVGGPRIAHALLKRGLDGDDPFVPLLLWWAVERHADHDKAMMPFLEAADWGPSLLRDTVLGRLARRYASSGNDWGVTALLKHVRRADERHIVLCALDEGTKGRGPDWFAEHAGFRQAITKRAEADPADPILVRLLARMGGPGALERVRGIARDSSAPPVQRLAMLDLLRDLADHASAGLLLALAAGEEPDTLRLGALQALAALDDDRIAARLLDAYAAKPAAWQARAREVLLGRRVWAAALLGAIESGRIAASAVPLDQVSRIALFRDEALDARVKNVWGRLAGPTPEEKLAEVRRLNNDLRAGPGDPELGRALFTKHCATCHRLRGEGNTVGPDLTGANRGDRDWLLASLVDPSGIVRKEYAASLIGLKDGRVLTGLLAEDAPGHVTFVDARAERTTVPRDQIETIADSPASLMPESLYRELSPQQLRDLFAFLQAP